MRFRTRNGREKGTLRILSGRLFVATAALAALGVMGGCSSSSGSHVAYVAGGATAVSAFRIDNHSGSLSALFGAPYVAGNSPSSIVMHPSGKFLYVANQADSTISLFTINSTTGALTEVLPRTPAGGLSPDSMIMDSGGSFLFVGNQGSNDVWSFQIGATGALTQVSNVSVGSGPAGLLLTSSGVLYVPVPNFSAIYAFSVSAGVFTPVANQSFAVSNGVGGIAVDSGGKFLYATNPAVNTVSAFAIQPGGSLAAMPGLTTAAGTTPVAAAVGVTGNFLYVVNSGSGNLSQFMIDGTTGTLTAFLTATVGVGTNPIFIVTDPDGKFVFVGNTGSSSVTELSVDGNGSLTNSNTMSPGFVPRSLVVTP